MRSIAHLYTQRGGEYSKQRDRASSISMARTRGASEGNGKVPLPKKKEEYSALYGAAVAIVLDRGIAHLSGDVFLRRFADDKNTACREIARKWIYEYKSVDLMEAMAATFDDSVSRSDYAAAAEILEHTIQTLATCDLMHNSLLTALRRFNPRIVQLEKELLDLKDQLQDIVPQSAAPFQYIAMLSQCALTARQLEVILEVSERWIIRLHKRQGGNYAPETCCER